MLDVTVINAYILYREDPVAACSKPLSHMDFRLAVARGLINGFSSRKRKAALEVSAPVIKQPTKLEPTKIDTKRSVWNCVVCAKGPDRTSSGYKIQTSWECKNCAVALFKEKSCFGLSHNYQQ